MVTEEIRAVLVAGGSTPDFTNVNQLLTAIKSLITSNSLSSIQTQALIEQYAGQAIQLTGSSNTFTGAVVPAITANASLGEPVTVFFPSAITAAATINLGGGVTALVDAQGNAFSTTNTVPSGNSIVQYNTVLSKFQVLGLGGIDQVARNSAAQALSLIGGSNFAATNWSVKQVGTNLMFSYSGANKAYLDTSGNMHLAGDVFINQTF